jgi:hypothetical protein
MKLYLCLFPSLGTASRDRLTRTLQRAVSLYIEWLSSAEGPQKETKIYSNVMGPSVSQIAGASPFCRALKVFLVEE